MTKFELTPIELTAIRREFAPLRRPMFIQIVAAIDAGQPLTTEQIEDIDEYLTDFVDYLQPWDRNNKLIEHDRVLARLFFKIPPDLRHEAVEGEKS